MLKLVPWPEAMAVVAAKIFGASDGAAGNRNVNNDAPKICAVR